MDVKSPKITENMEICAKIAPLTDLAVVRCDPLDGAVDLEGQPATQVKRRCEEGLAEREGHSPAIFLLFSVQNPS